MSSPSVDLRDEVYTRLLLKRSLNQFSFNNFGTRMTWKPSASPEEMNKPIAQGGYKEGGLVTIVGGLFGDHVAIDRDNLVVGEYSVKIGYAKYIESDVASTDTSPIDGLVNFVEELEEMCRKEVSVTADNGSEMAYVRTEYEKDDSGLPFHFVRISETSTFEAYFDVYFQVPLP